MGNLFLMWAGTVGQTISIGATGALGGPQQVRDRG